MDINQKRLSGIQDSGNIAYEVVNELRQFWTVKGYYLTLKCVPNTRLSGDEVEEILLYLARYTQLLTIPSFKLLTRAQLALLTKYMTMRDDRNMRIRINCWSKRSAEVFILLTGEATISSGETTLKLPRGSLFGAIQLFENILMNIERPIEGADEITVNIEKGTILKISARDFFDKVLLRAVKQRPKHEVDPVMIDPQTQITEEELIEKAKIKAEMSLPNKVQDFLSEFRFMPPPVNYIFMGSPGRSFQITRESSQVLFVLIQGTIRLDIVPNKKRKEGHTISHRRSGKRATQFKMNHSMPIVRYDKGAIFTFTENSFIVGQNPTDFVIFHPARVFSAYIRTQPNANDNVFAEYKNYVFIPYHFTATFENSALYFAIPFKLFPTVAPGLPISKNHTLINTQLEIAQSFLYQRVQKLLPWLNGEMILPTKEIEKRKVVETVIDLSVIESDTILNKTTPEPERRNPLLGAFIMGGFVNYIPDNYFAENEPEGNEVDQNSIQEEEPNTNYSFDESPFLTDGIPPPFLEGNTTEVLVGEEIVEEDMVDSGDDCDGLQREAFEDISIGGDLDDRTLLGSHGFGSGTNDEKGSVPDDDRRWLNKKKSDSTMTDGSGDEPKRDYYNE